MLFKKSYLLIILLLLFSCKNEKLLPNVYELREVSTSYLGTYELTLYNFNSPKPIDKIEVKNYPLEEKSDLIRDRWRDLDENKILKNFILSELNNIITTTEEKADRVNDIKSNLETNKEIFISGYYKNFKDNEKESFKRYYYFYLLNFSEEQLYRFKLITL
jgi:hypothetical protein